MKLMFDNYTVVMRSRIAGITMLCQFVSFLSRNPSAYGYTRSNMRWITSHTLSQHVNVINARPTSNDLSLDTMLISSQPNIIIEHLHSRKADVDLINKVMQIKELRTERNKCIMEGDRARSTRKALSKDIGTLMKNKMLAEVDALKVAVDKAHTEADLADGKLVQIDKQINDILSVVPNLLDDR